MSDRDPPAGSEPKRRRVRKGTRSCWDCRRRKLRCQFALPDDAACIGCRSRGAVCRSQELEDDAPAPRRRPQRRPADGVTQRLHRLERMVARMAGPPSPSTCDEHDRLDATDATAEAGTPMSGHASAGSDSGDVLGTSVADNTPVAQMLGISDMLARNQEGMATPESDSEAIRAAQAGKSGSTAPRGNTAVSATLHALFPPQQVVDAIVHRHGSSDTRAHYVASTFFSKHDLDTGIGEPASSLAVVPPVSSHPAVLAKRLLQLAICMHLLPPDERYRLRLQEPVDSAMRRISDIVSCSVAPNDDLVASVEGLQCLLLLGLLQQNLGDMRKAWLNYRRALNLGQLMGIDCGASRPVKSCDLASDPRHRPTAERLWFRINWLDRYVSLLLGLPVGAPNHNLVWDHSAVHCSPREKLERQLTIITAQVIDRNRANAGEAYGLTHSLDHELETAASALGKDWWEKPFPPAASSSVSGMVSETGDFMVQIHYFLLLILLHLPYLLRSPQEARHEYSKATCMRASREVLRRYNTYRTVGSPAAMCRHVDFASLIAAMALLLGYLGMRATTGSEAEAPLDAQRRLDRHLAEQVRGRMEHVAVLNQDRLSHESAAMIAKLLPIVDLVDQQERRSRPAWESNGTAQGSVQLNVPHLGTVNLDPTSPAGVPPTILSAVDPVQSGELSQTNSLSYQTAVTGVVGIDARQAPQAVDNGHLDTRGWISSPASYSSSSHRQDDARGQGDMFPDMTAGTEDWTFQGIDTAFWTLLNGAGPVQGI